MKTNSRYDTNSGAIRRAEKKNEADRDTAPRLPISVCIDAEGNKGTAVRVSPEAAAKISRAKGFPHYDLSAGEKKDKLRKLLDYDYSRLIRRGIVKQMTYFNPLASCYFPHMWAVRAGGNRTTRELFLDSEELPWAMGKRNRLRKHTNCSKLPRLSERCWTPRSRSRCRSCSATLRKSKWQRCSQGATDMATAAEQQSEAKLRYKVTLVIKASKVEAVAKWTKDAFGDVVVEKVEKVAAFVSGEWSQAVYGEDYIDEKQGKPKMGEWVNTDGRTIHEYTKTGGWVEPEGGGTKVYKKFKKPVTTYVVRDEFGAVDEAKTWEEAQRLYRAPVSESEALEMADHIARMIVKSDTYAPHAVEEAQEYLTARRIKVEPEELESEDARRKPDRSKSV